MICSQCSYDPLDVHRTGDSLITYCQQCGTTTESKREPTRQRWTDIERRKHLRAQEEIEPFRPSGRKKKRKGQG